MRRHVLFKNKIKTSLYVDRELWAKFKRLALEKHGNFHGGLTAEVEEALRNWLSAHTKDTQNFEIKNRVNPQPRVFSVYKNVKEYLKRQGIEYQCTLEKLVEAISFTRGNDRRTVRKWLNEFVKYKCVKEISTGRIYELL